MSLALDAGKVWRIKAHSWRQREGMQQGWAAVKCTASTPYHGETRRQAPLPGKRSRLVRVKGNPLAPTFLPHRLVPKVGSFTGSKIISLLLAITCGAAQKAQN